MHTPPLKVVFAGTPDFAAEALSALIDSRHQVVAVYTQPDRPAGRGRKLKASPVKSLAEQHAIAVYQPESLKTAAAQQQLRELDADIMIVAAYGLLLPQAVLDIPRLGCLNIHASLLPRWRGAAPIQRAILAGDSETGITIMQMDAGLDTGDMLSRTACPIEANETGGSLHDKLATLGAQCLLSTLDDLQNDNIKPVAQDEARATYAHKLLKQEARLDWSQPATQLERQVRAFNPWPIAFFEVDDKTVRVWQAEVITEHDVSAYAPGTVIGVSKQGIDIACGENCLRLIQLQPPGKKAMDVAAFLNGRSDWLSPGKQLAGV
ncbi:MAG: methionyl-tRNA formyltransferase [Thioalkalispiraceae bacterium]|jgi:methionyl-tRNA formyltransferase